MWPRRFDVALRPTEAGGWRTTRPLEHPACWAAAGAGAGRVAAAALPVVNPRQTRDFARATGSSTRSTRRCAHFGLRLADPDPAPAAHAASPAGRCGSPALTRAGGGAARHRGPHRDAEQLRSRTSCARRCSRAPSGVSVTRCCAACRVWASRLTLLCRSSAGPPPGRRAGRRFNRDSGRLRGRRTIWGGRARARRLYSSAPAARSAPYQRLLAAQAWRYRLHAQAARDPQAMLKHHTPWRA